MTINLPSTTQGYYRFSVSSFYFLQGLVFASWAARIPDVKLALGMSDAQLGMMLFAIPAGQMVSTFYSGVLVGRYGSKLMLLLAAILNPLLLISLGLASSFMTLAAMLFCFGMAVNMLNISVNTQGVGIERLYGRSILASFHGMWSLGGLVGVAITMLMRVLGVDTLMHFVVVFAVSLGLILKFYPSVLPRDARKKVKDGGGVLAMFRGVDAFILLLGLISFCCMVAEGTMFDWSGVYFRDVVLAPDSLVSLGYLVFMVTMSAGRFMADYFVTRFGRMRVLQTCGMLIALGMLLAVALPMMVTAALGFLLVGFGVSSVVPVCYSLAGQSKRVLPSIAIAAVSTIGFIGFLMGPPVIGLISEFASLRWAFSLIAMIGFSTVLLAPYLRKES